MPRSARRGGRRSHRRLEMSQARSHGVPSPPVERRREEAVWGVAHGGREEDASAVGEEEL
jgi:hypothetical protein